jgi:hypothetical protein
MTPAARSVRRTPAPPPEPDPRTAARTAASRYASAQLDPRPDAAAQARHLTRDCLARWNLHALADDAQAIAAELTANAVAAVPPGTPGLAITYAIHARHPELRIYTWDIGPGQPAPAVSGDYAETRRGLAIIDALTGSNWGWWPTPASGGKVVWAALRESPAARTLP